MVKAKDNSLKALAEWMIRSDDHGSPGRNLSSWKNTEDSTIKIQETRLPTGGDNRIDRFRMPTTKGK